MGKAFLRAKKSLAKKLGGTEYLKIRLYDLRHYYGTMLYYKTKDLIHVKNMMGHKNINTTMRYMHVLRYKEDEWAILISTVTAYPPLVFNIPRLIGSK